MNGRLFVLVEFVLALRVIAARNEAGNEYPIVFVQLFGVYVLSATVLVNGPCQKLGLFIGPIFLGLEGFFALILLQPIKNF